MGNEELVKAARANVSFLRWKSPRDERVLEAMANVDRKNFLPFDEEYTYLDYRDSARPIGYGATCSQPSLVAVTMDLLDLQPGQQVLGIGTGCGYADAIASLLVRNRPGNNGLLTTVEIVPELAEMGCRNLQRYFGSDDGGIKFVTRNGFHGFSLNAPYDAIYMAAAIPLKHKPVRLLEQLVPSGKLICPERIGELERDIRSGHSEYVLYTKKNNVITREVLGEVGFMPLRV